MTGQTTRREIAMKCPICGGELTLKHRSLAERDHDIYFCAGCPMVYALLRDHEKAAVQKTRELIETFGGPFAKASVWANA